MAAQLDGSRPIRVGVIGAGEVSQVIHLPTLSLLRHLFETVAICDVSRASVEHAQAKFHIPHIYTDSAALVAQRDIDVVLIASSDEHHAMHAIQAAEAGKHILIEKPMALTRQEGRQIEEARIRNGVHVFVAYMRRYTPVWAVFLDELAKAGTINFARVFDYSGPNSTFVGQSSTAPKIFGQDVPEEAKQDKQRRAQAIARAALGEGKGDDARLNKLYRLLGSLGSHDLSCMRHAFGGVPDACPTAFASPSGDFIGATFIYNQQPSAEAGSTPFQVSYETGIHEVGAFDAYIEAYCDKAVVRLDYDTPYVKGLPILVTVRQNTGADGRGYEERKIRPTFVDAYSAEFVRLHAALQTPVSKAQSQQTLLRDGWADSVEMCGPGDAMKDLDVFDMIMKHLS